MNLRDKINEGLYKLHLAVERRERGLNLAIEFDPKAHPRDMKGRFRDILDKLGEGQQVNLPDGTNVARVGGVFHVDKRDEGEFTTKIHTVSTEDSSKAAQEALDYSASLTKPESVGGSTRFKNFDDAEAQILDDIDAAKKVGANDKQVAAIKDLAMNGFDATDYEPFDDPDVDSPGAIVASDASGFSHVIHADGEIDRIKRDGSYERDIKTTRTHRGQKSQLPSKPNYDPEADAQAQFEKDQAQAKRIQEQRRGQKRSEPKGNGPEIPAKPKQGSGDENWVEQGSGGYIAKRGNVYEVGIEGVGAKKFDNEAAARAYAKENEIDTNGMQRLQKPASKPASKGDAFHPGDKVKLADGSVHDVTEVGTGDIAGKSVPYVKLKNGRMVNQDHVTKHDPSKVGSQRTDKDDVPTPDSEGRADELSEGNVLQGKPGEPTIPAKGPTLQPEGIPLRDRSAEIQDQGDALISELLDQVADPAGPIQDAIDAFDENPNVDTGNALANLLEDHVEDPSVPPVSDILNSWRQFADEGQAGPGGADDAVKQGLLDELQAWSADEGRRLSYDDISQQIADMGIEDPDGSLAAEMESKLQQANPEAVEAPPNAPDPDTKKAIHSAIQAAIEPNYLDVTGLTMEDLRPLTRQVRSGDLSMMTPDEADRLEQIVKDFVQYGEPTPKQDKALRSWLDRAGRGFEGGTGFHKQGDPNALGTTAPDAPGAFDAPDPNVPDLKPGDVQGLEPDFGPFQSRDEAVQGAEDWFQNELGAIAEGAGFDPNIENDQAVQDDYFGEIQSYLPEAGQIAADNLDLPDGSYKVLSNGIQLSDGTQIVINEHGEVEVIEPGDQGPGKVSRFA